MNRDYTYLDGKVIISDENNNKKQSDYYDNLDEVLAQENLIETMEKKIQELEEKSAHYKKHNKKHFIPAFSIAAGLISVISTPIMVNWFKHFDSLAVAQDTIFGPMSGALIVSLAVPLTLTCAGIAGDLFMHSLHKNWTNTEKGINCELNFLKSQIVKEKEALENLKKDKSKENESTEFRTVKVDDLQRLKNLRNWLSFYYDLGYNGKKYYRYYRQGTFDSKLQRYYNDSERQIAKKHMEEKGKAMTLKKKRERSKAA